MFHYSQRIKNCMVVFLLQEVVAVLKNQSGPGGLHEDTMLLVLGDHGQTLNGDHGGGTSEEVYLFLHNGVPMCYERKKLREIFLFSLNSIVGTMFSPQLDFEVFPSALEFMIDSHVDFYPFLFIFHDVAYFCGWNWQVDTALFALSMRESPGRLPLDLQSSTCTMTTVRLCMPRTEMPSKVSTVTKLICYSVNSTLKILMGLFERMIIPQLPCFMFLTSSRLMCYCDQEVETDRSQCITTFPQVGRYTSQLYIL